MLLISTSGVHVTPDRLTTMTPVFHDPSASTVNIVSPGRTAGAILVTTPFFVGAVIPSVAVVRLRAVSVVVSWKGSVRTRQTDARYRRSVSGTILAPVFVNVGTFASDAGRTGAAVRIPYHGAVFSTALPTFLSIGTCPARWTHVAVVLVQALVLFLRALVACGAAVHACARGRALAGRTDRLRAAGAAPPSL